MSTTNECCGWKGWAEMAGMDADGRPIRPGRPTDPVTVRAERPAVDPVAGRPSLATRVARLFRSRDAA